MNLNNLIKIYASHGCSNVYVKPLSPNDNSKNQVYLGGNFEVLNLFPIKEVVADDSGDWSKVRFKSKVDFYWLNDNGAAVEAPDAQLILYPKYPEVRFSGFLKGCSEAPSDLMTSRLEGRLLFFGVSATAKILGFVAAPESEVSEEFSSLGGLETQGVFKVISIVGQRLVANGRKTLLHELRRIHKLGWIPSKRLDGAGNIVACGASNCGGYTLEAELGIRPNGDSAPDFLGWEVKQFHVAKFENYKNSIITLMTPEPTDGFYVSKGVRKFIEKFGYKDMMGRPDRMNFGGIHKVGSRHGTTGLQLVLDGYDIESQKIVKSSGSIALIDNKDVVAASWSFSSLLKHWNKKHNKASYIPSLSANSPELQYSYGNNIILGSGTDFTLFLYQMAIGNIYYDPGIKMENISTGKPVVKRRSQFRIKSSFLTELYKKNEIVDVLDS